MPLLEEHIRVFPPRKEKGHVVNRRLDFETRNNRGSPPLPSSRSLTSDRGFLVLEELVPDETHDETGLSHRRVSEQDQLEVAHSPRRHDVLPDLLLVFSLLSSLPLRGLEKTEPPMRDENLWLE